MDSTAEHLPSGALIRDSGIRLNVIDGLLLPNAIAETHFPLADWWNQVDSGMSKEKNMKKRHIIATILISLFVISGIAGFSACTSIPLGGQKGGMEAQVNTAVAATLIQQLVETKVAAQSIALISDSAAQAQATETPLPTPTPVPTESAQPTVAATAEVAQPTATTYLTPTAPASPASSPKIIADQNTNCRVGPSTGYAIQTYFLKGAESTVEGRDKGKDWWYIVSPDEASEYCWVWDGSTTVVGDTSTLPVVEAPAGANTEACNPNYYCNAYYPYGCWNYYPNYCGKPVNWWLCCPYANCVCKPVYHNPCKKWGCPPVTVVNYHNYCKNYPKCCD
jgi:hypothetical protein